MKAAKQILKGAGKSPPQRGYLDGQMLIAMPSMRDERFARTLIYVCAHSSEGAMGIIVNQPAANVNFADLLVQLEVIKDSDLIQLPRRAGACPLYNADIAQPDHRHDAGGAATSLGGGSAAVRGNIDRG